MNLLASVTDVSAQVAVVDSDELIGLKKRMSDSDACPGGSDDDVHVMAGEESQAAAVAGHNVDEACDANIEPVNVDAGSLPQSPNDLNFSTPTCLSFDPANVGSCCCLNLLASVTDVCVVAIVDSDELIGLKKRKSDSDVCPGGSDDDVHVVAGEESQTAVAGGIVDEACDGSIENGNFVSAKLSCE